MITIGVPIWHLALLIDDTHAAPLEPGVGLQAWRYRPWVQKIIDQQMRVLAKQKKPTIGFHIRGGDLLRQEKLKVSTLCIKQYPSITFTWSSN